MTAPKSPREKKPKPPKRLYVKWLSGYGYVYDEFFAGEGCVKYIRADSTPSERERLERAVLAIAIEGSCYSHSPTSTWPMSLLRKHEKSPLFFGALARLELHLRASRQSRRKGGV